MPKKVWGPWLVFVGAFAIGALIAINPLDIHLGNDRNPASLQKNFDLTRYEGDDLVVAARARILSGLKIQTRSTDYAISFGHFLFKASDESIKKACEEFESIEMIWFAEGMASSGAPITLRLKAPCVQDGDISRTAYIHIPFSKIMTGQAQDGEFQFAEYPNESWEFSGLSGEWPDTWVLKEMAFSSSRARIDIDAQAVVEVLGQPLVIHLK